MTLPEQELRALNATVEFLVKLARPGGYGRVPSEVRDIAARLTHHYPRPSGMQEVWTCDPLREHLVCGICGFIRDPMTEAKQGGRKP